MSIPEHSPVHAANHVHDPIQVVQGPVLPEAAPAELPAAVPEAPPIGENEDAPSEEVVISTQLQNFLISLSQVLPNLVSVKTRARAR